MQSKDRWTTSRTAVYNLGYHIIWCPKYRKPVLVGEVESRLTRLIHEKANELKCSVEKLEIMPDHVHMFIKTPPTLPVQFVVGQIKGYSSRILRSEFKHLKRRLPCMWTRSYYAESIGHISKETVRRYIENQKNK